MTAGTDERRGTERAPQQAQPPQAQPQAQPPQPQQPSHGEPRKSVSKPGPGDQPAGCGEQVEQTLDDALADSFPASDPVSIVTSQREEAWEDEDGKPEPDRTSKPERGRDEDTPRH